MYEKIRQIRNGFLFREVPQCTRFFIKIECFGTFNVEWTEKNEKFKTSKPEEWEGGMCLKYALRTKLKCLNVI